MRLLASTLLFAAVVLAETCSTPDGTGNCQSTSSCTGYSLAGYCSGSASNQCCITKTCSTSQGSGICKNTANGCSGGTFVSGACPGSSSIKCCVTGASSGISGFDISQTQTQAFWTCAGQTYQKVAIRGYQQACGLGGRVDPNLLTNYNAARAVGITNIDIYMFPCTGTQPTGVACKAPATQVNELINYISSNNLQVGTIWFDVEPTSGTCNAWNLGSTQNLALARQFVSLIRNTSYRWGIYGNGNQWTQMFASRSTDIGSDLPLWAVQDDGTPGVGTTTTFMGGWTQAAAKQYSLDANVCGGTRNADLDSFST